MLVVVAVDCVVEAVVVVDVNMEVADGSEAVASFIRPQIPLVTWLTASPTTAVEAPAAAAMPAAA